MHTRIVLIGVILLTYFVVTVRAQSSKYDIPKREKTVKVMVLGVFHFNNPNADYAKFAGIDVLTPQRQKEIESVVDQLARFEPTKIALERPVREAPSGEGEWRRADGPTGRPHAAILTGMERASILVIYRIADAARREKRNRVCSPTGKSRRDLRALRASRPDVQGVLERDPAADPQRFAGP